MRIEHINVHRARLPVVGGAYRMASATVEALDSTLVEIVADNGLSGWGETCPVGPVYQPHHALGARAALEEICPGLIGADATSPRAVARLMDDRLSGHGYAKAAIDIAVLDLLARHLGVSVGALLGGAITDRVPTYYSTIVGEPDDTARIARQKVEAGYQRLQIKVGGKNLEQDVETIHKV